MQINQIKATTHRKKKRIGRGGKRGTYSGRGIKGQKARSGYKKRATFEGGRSGLVEHTKKNRGFKKDKNEAKIFNLNKIELKFEKGEIVNFQSLQDKKLISGKNKKAKNIKILGDGELTKNLIFEGVLVSKSAEKKIKKAGGEVKK